MEIKKVALVLQGGAARGAFTAGVLDVFLENEIYFQYISAVSAGALNALNYLSQQIGRSKSLFVNVMGDKKFMNRKYLLTKKTIFNFDYLFNEVSLERLPFDFKTYHENKARLIVATTSCESGKPYYHEKNNDNDFFKAVAASSSLPLLSAPINVSGQFYLDGGLSTPIPFKKAFEDGSKKVVVISTRDKSYRKDENERQKVKLLKAFYRKYPNLIQTTITYPKTYNEEANLLEKLEKENIAFVVRPKEPITLKRTEKDIEELEKLYFRGKEIGEEALSELLKFLNENEAK